MTKTNISNLYVKFILTIICVCLVILVFLLAKQTIFIGSRQVQKQPETNNSVLINPTSTPALIPTNPPDKTTSAPADSHAGMKEVKGMNCQSQNNDGTTNCTEYDYWYNPNEPSRTGTLAPNMLQGAH